MNFNEKLDGLNEERRRIIVEFHSMRVQKPQMKKINLIRETAQKLEYSIAPTTHNNSFVMRVIQQWEKQI